MKSSIRGFAILLTLIAASLWTSAANAFLLDTYTRTKYPTVLVHGFMGFDKIVGIEYFYRIPYEISRSGGKVYTVNVPSVNSSEVRGESLLAEVKQIIAATGAQKVHLVGHSHGAPTIRYVAAVRPDLIASATSVGGANGSADLADLIYDVTQSSQIADTLIDKLAGGLGSLIGALSGNSSEQDGAAALYALSAGAAEFNAHYPQGIPATFCGNGAEVVNGVRYYSWSGAGQLTNALDISDVALGITSLAYNGKNDGLISSCKSRLGKVIRDDYNMNHVDEINHLLGMTDIWGTKPAAVYRAQANRLKNLDL